MNSRGEYKGTSTTRYSPTYVHHHMVREALTTVGSRRGRETTEVDQC